VEAMWHVYRLSVTAARVVTHLQAGDNAWLSAVRLGITEELGAAMLVFKT